MGALVKDRSERSPKGPEPESGQAGRVADGGFAQVEADHEVERSDNSGFLTDGGSEGGGSKEPTPPKDRQYQLLQEQQPHIPQYQGQTFQDTGVQYQEQVVQFQDQQHQYHNISLQHIPEQGSSGVQQQQPEQPKSSEHLGGAASGEEQTPATETHGPVNDSDTGAADNEVKDGKGKKKKERTRKRTHLGPRIKVLRIVTEDENSEAG